MAENQARIEEERRKLVRYILIILILFSNWKNFITPNRHYPKTLILILVSKVGIV